MSVATHIVKKFHGLPYMGDWTGHPLPFQVERRHIKGSVPLDPNLCAAALACAERYGSTQAHFWRHVAYVDVVVGGARGVYRFNVPTRAYTSVIVPNDKGGNVTPGLYEITPPTVSQTLAKRAEYNRNRTLRIASGIPKGTAALGARKKPVLDATIRIGIGKVKTV